jgi:hypothetical protein
LETQNTNTVSAAPVSQPIDHTALLEWSAPRSYSHERGKQWYRGGAVTILAIAAYGILTGAWSLAVVTVLVGGLYFLIRKEPPVVHTLRIEQSGVTYDGDFLYWGDFESAWFVRTPVGPELHLMRKKGSPKEIILLTPHIDNTALRATLSRFLTVESDRQEHLFDVLIRLCKL